MQRIDVSGMTFGRLTAKTMVYEHQRNSKAVCVCACGKETVALVYNLRNGNTASCGCLGAEVRAERGRRLGPIQGKKNATHGMSKTPTYISWLDARKRCFSPQNKRYAEYGGRGISMEPAWVERFEAFLADMGVAPEGTTLDRIDVNGDYRPGNCRWITQAEQMRNTRANVTNWDDVRTIRRLHERGASVKELVAAFPMTNSNMRMILSRQTWKEAEQQAA